MTVIQFITQKMTDIADIKQNILAIKKDYELINW